MMDKNVLRALEKFGLSEKESKVYFACLELDNSSAYKISEKANIARTLTYDILKRLIEMRLVSSIQAGNKKCFRAENPGKIVEILKEREFAIRSVMKIMLNIKKQSHHKDKPYIHVFEGKEGIKRIYEDVLKSGIKEYMAIGGSGIAPKVLPYYMHKFYEKKAKKKINMKLIFRNNKKGRERAKWLKKFGYMDIRFMPDKYATPVSIYVYSYKTALLIWSQSEPLAIRIDSRFITNGFRNYILALWESAKKMR